jgi:hypothetical protein
MKYMTVSASHENYLETFFELFLEFGTQSFLESYFFIKRWDALSNKASVKKFLHVYIR